MPIETKTLDQHIYDKLTEANWTGLQIDNSKQLITCPKGKILVTEIKIYVTTSSDVNCNTLVTQTISASNCFKLFNFQC